MDYVCFECIIDTCIFRWRSMMALVIIPMNNIKSLWPLINIISVFFYIIYTQTPNTCCAVQCAHLTLKRVFVERKWHYLTGTKRQLHCHSIVKRFRMDCINLQLEKLTFDIWFVCLVFFSRNRLFSWVKWIWKCKSKIYFWPIFGSRKINDTIYAILISIDSWVSIVSFQSPSNFAWMVKMLGENHTIFFFVHFSTLFSSFLSLSFTPSICPNTLKLTIRLLLMRYFFLGWSNTVIHYIFDI